MVTTQIRDQVSTLPVSLSPLVGREREVAAVRDLLLQEHVRLLTLTGPGGVGKTRLGLQVATKISHGFDDGVRFVPLAAIRDPALVIPTIAQALGLLERGEQPPAELLRVFLRNRNVLLLLDNLEQVISSAEEIADLLAACSRVSILVTSREPLRIAGEQEFAVAPLALPAELTRSTPDLLAECDATALFLQRVRAIKPDFVVTDENARVIAEICVRLDGLPLAIELAAARVKILSPHALRDRLVNRLVVLSRDTRDAPDRLRTMRSAIAWSYDLLNPAEQALFPRLSVFAAGFSLAAAEVIAGPGDDSPLDVLEGISSLVDKSLLRQVDEVANESRFAMFETIRDYGLEQLTVTGEDDATRRRLMMWCLSLAEQEPYLELFGTAYRGWLTRIDAEYRNLRLALEWAIDQAEAEVAQRLIFPLCRFWFLRGYLSEGRALAERALTLSAETSIRVRALAMAACGFLAWSYGEFDEADHRLAEAIGLLRPLDETVSIAIVLYVSALVAQAQDEHARAQRFLEEALPLFRDASETTPFVPHVLGALGSVVYRQHGNIDRAEMYFSEALEQFRQLDNAYGVGTTLTSLGRIARDRGDFGRAATLFAESLNLHWEDGDKVRIAGCLNGLAIVAALSRQSVRAARLFGAAEALREAIGAPVPRHLGQYARALRMARQALGEHAFTEAWAAGRTLPLIDAIPEAAAVSPASDHSAPLQTTPAERYGLTARELEVLRLLPRGLTNREIGDRLYIAERTAATHVQNIFGKLDISSRSEAAAFAVERGLA